MEPGVADIKSGQNDILGQQRDSSLLDGIAASAVCPEQSALVAVKTDYRIVTASIQLDVMSSARLRSPKEGASLAGYFSRWTQTDIALAVTEDDQQKVHAVVAQAGVVARVLIGKNVDAETSAPP